MQLNNISYNPVSMVTHNGLQRVIVSYEANIDMHLYLSVLNKNNIIAENIDVAIKSGKCVTPILLPVAKESFEACWILKDKTGKEISKIISKWDELREWTMYVMISSHTDIGLHNSQYIQRYNSSEFLKQAMNLCDKTENEKDENKYRYTMEGTWFWNNYAEDHGEDAAKNIVENYIKPGKIGLCGGIAGNHTHVFGLEEMCRSTYGRKEQLQKWGLNLRTLSMIDNNGLSWEIIQPYAEAGYENVFFAPNQWNPLPSTVWHCDTDVSGYIWNTEAGGGGARIDVRYDSEHPMVFYWQAANKRDKLLVWCSTQYNHGGESFGMKSSMEPSINTLLGMENAFSKQLPLMEKRLPYNIWLFACYGDDQQPSLGVTECIKMWNDKWAYPKLRTAGNLDEPFGILKKNFDEQIPTVSGEITGGWYQHPVSTAELLAKKFEADRLLPTAEKLSSIAAVVDDDFEYPKYKIDRAWKALLLNDEHSYGTSGYQGQRVYETWLQHRDWIDKALNTANKYSALALNVIAKHIDCNEEKKVLFNPTLQKRYEFANPIDKCVEIPPLGYVAVNMDIPSKIQTEICKTAPIIENNYYKIEFADNGAVSSIFDKELQKELIVKNSKCNNLIYTTDNHKTFVSPKSAEFEVIRQIDLIKVVSKIKESVCDAEIIQTVSLLNFEKRIDFDNKILHAKNLINNNRYYRYLYYAFPFYVENCKRYCHLNGQNTAQYGVDITGHGTDTYMACNEWCCVENDNFGIALFQKDSNLIEFGRIYSDKTDYKNLSEGSEIYSYVANDWLQMHCTGGSYLDFNFRYAITSYTGDYKSTKISELAELYINPVISTIISAQKGNLPQKYSFMSTNKPARLLTLKASEDRTGFIARMLGDTDNIKINFIGIDDFIRVSVDETPLFANKYNTDYTTYYCKKGGLRFIKDTYRDSEVSDYVYTGLITEPCATCGEDDGLLYLLWGQNIDKNLSHYEVYRSEKTNFAVNDDSFVARVEPEPYRCARYVDTDLGHNKKYYYRIKTVFGNERESLMSAEFSGITKEKLN